MPGGRVTRELWGSSLTSEFGLNGAAVLAGSFELRLLDWKGRVLSFVLNPSMRLENRFLLITKVLFSPEMLHVFPDSFG